MRGLRNRKTGQIASPGGKRDLFRLTESDKKPTSKGTRGRVRSM